MTVIDPALNRTALLRRLMSHVELDPLPGCWVWTASSNSKGYAQIALTRPGYRTMAKAYRVAYELLVAPIPDDLVIDHLCGNRRCIRPDHLEPVTRGENTIRGKELRMTCSRGHQFTTRSVSRGVGRGPGRERRDCRICARLPRWQAPTDADPPLFDLDASQRQARLDTESER